MINLGFRKLLCVLLFSLLVGCSPSEKPQEEKESEKTQPQTDAEFVEQATFTDLQGNDVAVSDYKGKVVMIDFWETWCKPCLASFPTLQQLQEDYPERFVVLAVTPGFTDSREDAQSFSEEHDYSFTYLMDSNKLHQKLGVQGIPYKVFVDAEGNFIKKSMGSYGPDEDYKIIQKLIKKHSGSEKDTTAAN
ncbi:TlpA family protein disulfide reductase [Fodinibius saliphilus]|uniref:TlpA family protein disulfide reductase n=1 Tax=Fodinibius saliphilus TaxID=1920650 RepID=UPI00110909D0|nr:TlpA disulfide reductase family protein [Fodinibius saliphilus]